MRMPYRPRLRIVQAVLVVLVLIAGALMVCVLGACSGVHVEPIEAQAPIVAPVTFDHSAFDRLLKRYVDGQGLVDYPALKAHADAELDPYLRQLAETDPSRLDSTDRLAFWINAYNANTLKLIVEHYPVASIRRITPVAVKGTSVNIPLVNSPFGIRFATVGGNEYTLDDIEHGIIRKRFDEPRIHFALVCAARSCPPLRREAYTGQRLDAQLDDQARAFLRDTTKNRINHDEHTIYLSRIFKWFGGDFERDGRSKLAFVTRFFDGEDRAALAAGDYRIKYLPYDWRLNDQAQVDEARGQ